MSEERQGDGETRRQGAGVRRRSTQTPFLLVSLSILVALWGESSQAADPWVDTRQIGPFICQATFPLKECESVFAELEGLEAELVRTLGIEPAREPIYIYLFSSEKSHRAYFRKHFPDVPWRRALFVREGGMAGVYAFRHPQLDVDLRHECTHAVLHASLPYVPLWLDEGLAKYFEVPESQRAFDHPYFGDLRWNMRVGMIQSIDSLEKRRDINDMGASEYRDSWAWVHFMFHSPTAGHAVLVQYLADVRRGAMAGQLSQRLAQSVDDPRHEMAEHFKHWRR
jgi:hypothetical protein